MSDCQCLIDVEESLATLYQRLQSLLTLLVTTCSQGRQECVGDESHLKIYNGKPIKDASTLLANHSSLPLDGSGYQGLPMEHIDNGHSSSLPSDLCPLGILYMLFSCWL